METFPGIPDDERGLIPKYIAFNIEHARKHEVDALRDVAASLVLGHVSVPFFLLKFNDKHAIAALEAYAASCEREFPTLAADILRKVQELKLGDQYLELRKRDILKERDTAEIMRSQKPLRDL